MCVVERSASVVSLSGEEATVGLVREEWIPAPVPVRPMDETFAGTEGEVGCKEPTAKGV